MWGSFSGSSRGGWKSWLWGVQHIRVLTGFPDCHFVAYEGLWGEADFGSGLILGPMPFYLSEALPKLDVIHPVCSCKLCCSCYCLKQLNDGVLAGFFQQLVSVLGATCPAIVQGQVFRHPVASLLP